MSTPVQEARELLRSQHVGMLATLSKKLGGYPFGSAVDYLLDHDACPVFLISSLAEHTKNLDQDPRCSLLVYEPADDFEIRGRATLVGDAKRITPDEALTSRYLQYFPQARELLTLPGFYFFRVETLQVRYIAGMGRVYWLDQEDFRPAASTLEYNDQGKLRAIEREFSSGLRACCREYYAIVPKELILLGLDCDGFDLRADNKILRFHFDKPVNDLQSARSNLNSLAKACHR